jgi:hypothetical protein
MEVLSVWGPKVNKVAESGSCGPEGLEDFVSASPSRESRRARRQDPFFDEGT